MACKLRQEKDCIRQLHIFFEKKKFISVQDIISVTCHNTLFISRSDGASWSQFLIASLNHIVGLDGWYCGVWIGHG